jgi:hypothetical protein
MHRSHFTLGVILIFIGVLSILNQFFNFDFFSMSTLWPLFILIPGLIFEFSYFTSRKDPGLLVPGGILTTIGTLFLFETFTNWYFAAYTWPIYPFAVAIGLFQLYLFGNREKGLLVPVFILSAVSFISFASMMFNRVFWWLDKSLIFPALLILIGLSLLFRNNIGKRLDK